MPWTIATVVALWWTLGLVLPDLGGFIHVPIVLALALLLVRIIQRPGQRGRQAGG